jgi:hypothetical protein
MSDTDALTQLESDLERLGLDIYVEALVASQAHIAALEAAARACLGPSINGRVWVHCLCPSQHRADCPLAALAALLEEKT